MMRQYWDWLSEHVVVKKRRKVILQEDEIRVDFNVQDKRKLKLEKEDYFDIGLLEKLIYENNTELPANVSEALRNNLRKVMDLHFSVKKGLVHIANISKFLN